MTLKYSPNRNPRVIVIQKLYSKIYNQDSNLAFPKHRFKKFIKDVVNGTIERNDLIDEEITKHLSDDLKFKNLDKVFSNFLVCSDAASNDKSHFVVPSCRRSKPFHSYFRTTNKRARYSCLQTSCKISGWNGS